MQCDEDQFDSVVNDCPTPPLIFMFPNLHLIFMHGLLITILLLLIVFLVSLFFLLLLVVVLFIILSVLLV